MVTKKLSDNVAELAMKRHRGGAGLLIRERQFVEERARSSAEEHYPDKVGGVGSNPTEPTNRSVSPDKTDWGQLSSNPKIEESHNTSPLIKYCRQKNQTGKIAPSGFLFAYPAILVSKVLHCTSLPKNDTKVLIPKYQPSLLWQAIFCFCQKEEGSIISLPTALASPPSLSTLPESIGEVWNYAE